jgi:glycosyltransferase involved in cell wall biosynthesis
MSQNNKNILFLSSNFPEPGGIEMVTNMLADYFCTHGILTHILTMKKNVAQVHSQNNALLKIVSMPGTLNDAGNRAFIQNYMLENGIQSVINQGAFSNFYLDWETPWKLHTINTLHGKPFWEMDAVCHATYPMIWNEYGSKSEKIKGLLKKSLIHLHPGLAFPTLKHAYRVQIEAASRYVVLDPSFKRLLEQKLYKGVPHPNIVCIENPMPDRQVTLEQKNKTVLFVGRLIRSSKRVDRLLKMWKIMEPLHQDWSLTIVGDGPDKARLVGLSNQLNLERVEFTGTQPASAYYKTASILCLTSSFEGMPLVVRDAQQYGTVPLVYDCSPAMKNLIENRVDGIIVQAFKQKQFVHALDQLMSDDGYLKKMSLNAHQSIKVKCKDHLEVVGNKWLALLEELEHNTGNSPKSTTTQTFI